MDTFKALNRKTSTTTWLSLLLGPVLARASGQDLLSRAGREGSPHFMNEPSRNRNVSTRSILEVPPKVKHPAKEGKHLAPIGELFMIPSALWVFGCLPLHDCVVKNCSGNSRALQFEPCPKPACSAVPPQGLNIAVGTQGNFEASDFLPVVASASTCCKL